jgi:hypothetical protein
LLLGSAGLLKPEFQKRITSITLTPGIDEQGPFYTVSLHCIRGHGEEVHIARLLRA